MFPSIALPLDAPKSIAKKDAVIFSVMVFEWIMKNCQAKIEINYETEY